MSSHESPPDLTAPLQAAAGENHVSTVSSLLDKGCTIDPTTIHKSVRGKSVDVLRLFMSRGWDVNQPLGHIGDALLLSISNHNLELTKFFLQHGADPNANLFSDLFTPLECAATVGSVPMIEALLKANATIKGRSALCHAARRGHVDAIAALLDHGANIDEIPDNDEIYENAKALGVQTALCAAAKEGKMNAVKLLVDRGANVRATDTKDRTARQLAEAKGHEEIAAFLKTAEAN